MQSTSNAGTSFPAPPLALLATEPLRALFDYCAARLGARAQAVGDGHPVIVFPGLGGAPFTTSQLRKHLAACGFDARCWGRGVNTGPEGELEEWLAALLADVRRVTDEAGRKASLVGWSLGGVYAREIARLAPDAVRQVVTLGTPFAALGGGSTHAETIYRMLGGDTSRLTPELQARLRETPPVPTTAIYSKSDGVVSWRGCIEKRTARSESVEVSASHLGMVTHPDVLRIVANRLAQPEGRWRPLKRRERIGRR